VVVESTGLFVDTATASKHITAGAKKVIITAPAKDPDVTLVLGVNEGMYEPSKHRIVSNASCTTNCLAPVAKVLNDLVGIKSGYMTTIHAYTNDQRILDQAHKDMRRARAAALTMIPTSTGAAAAVGLVLPELKGKLDGTAIRVPTPNVSVVDLKFVPGRETTVAEINKAMEHAAAQQLKGVLSYVTEELVSIDFNHSPYSSNFDSTQTQIVDGGLGRVLAWYDNEWGFSNRMLDTAVAMGKLLLAAAGSRSANTNPSRVSITPARTAIGSENIGPAETQVWNSPFSPQGSTPGGNSASSVRSNARPAKLAGSLRGSTQVKCALRPPAIISSASARVSRPHRGNSGAIPDPASFASR
jgi:glyceraldehyde 3-phosphate dehydrogenase